MYWASKLLPRSSASEIIPKGTVSERPNVAWGKNDPQNGRKTREKMEENEENIENIE
jgi:hypothetical protein